MTAYKSFVSDFPARCRDLLDGSMGSAEISGREVTLALTVASAALVIPFERINPSSQDHVVPDRTDASVSKLGKLLGMPFEGWVKASPGLWRRASTLQGQSIRGKHVEEWLREDALSSLDCTWNVGRVFAVLRNALAHGNLYSRTGAKGEITELVFLSQVRDRSQPSCPQCGAPPQLSDNYQGLVATPADFVSLLRTWVTFLESLTLSEEPIQGRPLEVDAFPELAV